MNDPIEGAELVESPTLRSRHLDRTDVLDKVGELAMLPNATQATTKQVAEFYDVPQAAIASLVHDHRAELESNGYEVLAGAQLNSLKESGYVGRRAGSLAVFSRTAVLNVGMLLKESEAARLVRRYLLTVEATATVEHRVSSLRAMRLAEQADWQNILEALHLAGAGPEDYAQIQNHYYMGLFGMTASEIRRKQKQIHGTPRKDGKGYLKSKSSKDYLTERQLKQLDSAVMATKAQLDIVFIDRKPSVAEVQEMATDAIRLVKPRVLSGGAA